MTSGRLVVCLIGSYQSTMRLRPVYYLLNFICRFPAVGALLAFQLSLAIVPYAVADANAAENSIKSGDIILSSPWVRAMLPGQATGGGYLTIQNTGVAVDRLMSVSSPNASLVEIHQMSMDKDVMKMRQITDGVEIPAGGKVELSPGGLHLMFKQVIMPFKVGETVKVTLKFTKGGKIDVEMPAAFVNPN